MKLKAILGFLLKVGVPSGILLWKVSAVLLLIVWKILEFYISVILAFVGNIDPSGDSAR